MTQKGKESAESDGSEQKKREEDESISSLFSVAGMFAIGEPGWADKHDEYLAETYIEDHAKNTITSPKGDEMSQLGNVAKI